MAPTGRRWPSWWSAAAALYGTPLYLYDLPTVHARVGSLFQALPSQVRVSYAVKANANLALVAELRRLGCGADISSTGELETVRAAGFGPDEVVYTGPAKSDREIADAVSWGVGIIVVESIAEAARISATALRAGVRQPVLLRVNPGAGLKRTGLALSAPVCKFGVDEADAAGAARGIAAFDGVELRGIHMSTESNVRSARRLLQRAEYAFALAEALRGDGRNIEVLDLGGGFGVPHFPGETALDLEAYGQGLRRLADRHHPVALVLELGRYPVAESGTYIVAVVAVKRSQGSTFALVDGGINHLYRPQLTPRSRPPLVLATGSGPVEPVTIGGPLLDSDDVLAENVRLPRPEVGDLLAIPGCGAYGYAHGLHGFCSRPTPPEAAWDGADLHLVRERGDPARVVDGQRLLRTRATG